MHEFRSKAGISVPKNEEEKLAGRYGRIQQFLRVQTDFCKNTKSFEFRSKYDTAYEVADGAEIASLCILYQGCVRRTGNDLCANNSFGGAARQEV